MAYDSPDYLIRREHCCPPTTAGATTKGSKFRHFQAIKLKKAHAAVITAGTATAHGYNIFVGTTSVGAIALSTNGTNVTASSGAIDVNVSSLEEISANSLSDATGVAQITYEFEVRPDATES